MKVRQGIVAGYNAPAMAAPLEEDVAQRRGLLLTAADVTTSAADSGHLVPMVEQAEEMTGQRARSTLADAGYHTAANLAASAQRGEHLVMPEGHSAARQRPYFKDKFAYDAPRDLYICPQGQELFFRGVRPDKNGGDIRRYRAPKAVCRACSVVLQCMKTPTWPRTIWIGPHDALLRSHRQWMETEEVRTRYAQRKEIVEPCFGILKEQMGLRRFLLRGLANVRAEFTLAAAAFNLRTLWRVMRLRPRPAPSTA